MKYLLTTYRTNLTIRTGRSPLRKQVQSPRDDLGKVAEEVGGSGGDEGSPVLKAKVGKYCKLEFGYVLVLNINKLLTVYQMAGVQVLMK